MIKPTSKRDYILVAYFFFGDEQQKIAGKVNVSQTQICELIEKHRQYLGYQKPLKYTSFYNFEQYDEKITAKF